MSRNVIINSGEVYSLLTVVGFAYTKRNRRYYTCLCACGKHTIVNASKLKLNHTKSCGCQKSLQSKVNIELNRPNMYLGDGVAPARAVYSQYIRHAHEKLRDFALTFEQWYAITQRPCHYCGVEKTNTARGTTKNNIFQYNGIDRLDNLQGYTVENSVPCCIVCNRAKRDLSYADFMQWISRIKAYNK